MADAICAFCGKRFSTTTGRGIYCSDDCKAKVKSIQRKIYRLRKNYNGVFSYPEEEIAPKQYKKICSQCGAEFMATNFRTTLCSDECRKASKKAHYELLRSTLREEKSRKEQQKQSLVEVCKEARTAGVSYGKMMAKRSGLIF